MILTLKSKFILSFFALLMLAFLVAPSTTDADTVELSVSPTLFEMAASPGQLWKSQVKVINTNKFPLAVYAQVMNFAPQGEAGQGKFLPVFEDFTEGTTLAEWIQVTDEQIVVPPEQSLNVPIVVQVPADASPGGHFAAIMIGTKPPEDAGAFRVATAQIVTSLFFVRISGDVIESGSIREFTAVKRFLQTPEADFSVRFENKGNVHIQPQGSITITNMWGKERGLIPINAQTHFGNVLPNSIRKFDFSWKGERSITDIGRYKASITLGYGLESKQFETASTYFYVIPVKALLIVLGSLLLAFLFISWAIRTYVRRMLALSGVDPYGNGELPRRSFRREGDVLIEKRRPQVEAPLVSGWQDLRTRLRNVTAVSDRLRTIYHYVLNYKLFFGSIAAFLVIFVLLFMFVREVGRSDKQYEVTINNGDGDVTLSSEDIIYETRHAEPVPSPVTATTQVDTSTSTEQTYALSLLNAGDVSGAAADLKATLEKKGYQIESIGSDFSESRAKTVIVYDAEYAEAALELSQILGKALLSANPDGAEAVGVTVYIGNDYTFQALSEGVQ